MDCTHGAVIRGGGEETERGTEREREINCQGGTKERDCHGSVLFKQNGFLGPSLYVTHAELQNV